MYDLHCMKCMIMRCAEVRDNSRYDLHCMKYILALVSSGLICLARHALVCNRRCAPRYVYVVCWKWEVLATAKVCRVKPHGEGGCYGRVLRDARAAVP